MEPEAWRLLCAALRYGTNYRLTLNERTEPTLFGRPGESDPGHSVDLDIQKYFDTNGLFLRASFSRDVRQFHTEFLETAAKKSR